MDNGPWLYYKLTNEPKGSGELKKGEGICFQISQELLKRLVGCVEA